MSRDTGRFLLLSLIASLVAGLVFTPGLPGEFVFDDIPNIVNNSVIHMTQLDGDALTKVATTPQLSGYMRILPTLTFALDYWRGGGAEPGVFKTTNIFIHALTTLVLAWFFRSLLLVTGVTTKKVQWLALAMALAWALHPLHVSSVLYAVQRLQTMGTLFLILALLAYLKARQAQMEGRPGRTGFLVTGLLWALAMSCKEDSVLLPAYTLALELTILHFAAADVRVTRLLQRTYLVAAIAGTAVYLFWIVPHYWHGEAYPARDFSTWERLLTQARVLCLYLWQILLPLPRNMPFYYDWLQPSRGLLQPWTTLPAALLLLALLGTAWQLRKRKPLFAFGALLFFSAHFIASNVVGLELAFEHRNHFALVGVVLAVGSLLADINLRLQLRTSIQVATCTGILLLMGGATALRAHHWRSNLTMAHASTQYVPTSARAWFEVCVTNFEMGGGVTKSNTHLDKAIEACRNGAIHASDSLNNPTLLIVLKSLRGDDISQDWAPLQEKIKTTSLSLENRRAPLILSYHMREGVELDKQQVLQALDTSFKRVNLGTYETASIGYFIMNDLGEPDLAIPYFIRVIEDAPPYDPFAQQLATELREKGRPDLAEMIEQLGLDRLRNSADSLNERGP